MLLINRLPTLALQYDAPYIKLYNKEPDHTFFKVFAYASYPLLNPYTKHKLQFHNKQCVFIVELKPKGIQVS